MSQSSVAPTTSQVSEQTFVAGKLSFDDNFADYAEQFSMSPSPVIEPHDPIDMFMSWLVKVPDSLVLPVLESVSSNRLLFICFQSFISRRKEEFFFCHTLALAGEPLPSLSVDKTL